MRILISRVNRELNNLQNSEVFQENPCLSIALAEHIVKVHGLYCEHPRVCVLGEDGPPARVVCQLGSQWLVHTPGGTPAPLPLECH